MRLLRQHRYKLEVAFHHRNRDLVIVMASEVVEPCHMHVFAWWTDTLGVRVLEARPCICGRAPRAAQVDPKLVGRACSDVFDEQHSVRKVLGDRARLRVYVSDPTRSEDRVQLSGDCALLCCVGGFREDDAVDRNDQSSGTDKHTPRTRQPWHTDVTPPLVRDPCRVPVNGQKFHGMNVPSTNLRRKLMTTQQTVRVYWDCCGFG